MPTPSGVTRPDPPRPVLYVDVRDDGVGLEAAHARPGAGSGLANIRTHLDYITYLMDRRSWLAGELPAPDGLAATSTAEDGLWASWLGFPSDELQPELAGLAADGAGGCALWGAGVE